jgi:hypothetical protein
MPDSHRQPSFHLVDSGVLLANNRARAHITRHAKLDALLARRDLNGVANDRQLAHDPLRVRKTKKR